MSVSVFDLFKIGIGPSSSHTVGPMRAAARFVERWLVEKGALARVARVRAEVFGSLALTGRGHGTDKAVLCGFENEWPDKIDPDVIPGQKTREAVGGHLHTWNVPQSRRTASTCASSARIWISASQKRSSSIFGSDSVGSIISVPATGKLIVGAWKP